MRTAPGSALLTAALIALAGCGRPAPAPEPEGPTPGGASLDEWAEKLGHGHGEPMQARWVFATLGPQAAPAVPALLKRLEKRPDDPFAHAALRWMGPAGKEALPALRKLFDGAPQARLLDAGLTMAALGTDGGESAAAFKEAFRSSEPFREKMSWGRDDLPPAWAVALGELLEDRNEYARAAALEALGRSGRAAAPALAALQKARPMVDWAAKFKPAPPFVPPDPGPRRTSTISEIMYRDAVRAFPLKEKTPGDVLVAALGNPAGGLNPLKGEEEKPDAQSAAVLLGRIGAPALPALRKPLESPLARRNAATALAAMPAEITEATDILMGMLADKEMRVRADAATGLARRKKAAAKAAPDLERLLADEAAEVRVAAAHAVFRVTGETERPLAALRPLLADRKSPLCRDALFVLCRMEKAAAPLAVEVAWLLGATEWDRGNEHGDEVTNAARQILAACDKQALRRIGYTEPNGGYEFED